MKARFAMALTALGVLAALSGCPGNRTDSGPTGTDAANTDATPPNTDAANTDAMNGTDSAVTDAGPATCMSYCTCYVATCDTDDTYLYMGAGDPMGDCLTDCGLLTQTVLDCRDYHCSVAAVMATNLHCDHAASMNGECM